MLNEKRLEPKETYCLNRKKVIKRSKPFLLLGEDGLQIVSYPLQMVRIRRLSTPKKMYSTLLEFSRMGEEKRWKYTEDDSVFNTVFDTMIDEISEK